MIRTLTSVAAPRRDRKRISEGVSGGGSAGGGWRNKETVRTKSGTTAEKRRDEGPTRRKQIQFDDWIHIAEYASS
jgi:hypothetical protein